MNPRLSIKPGMKLSPIGSGSLNTATKTKIEGLGIYFCHSRVAKMNIEIAHTNVLLPLP